MDSLTDAVWGKPYNMFDAPVAMCARTYWDSPVVVGDYFFLDKVQGQIRTLSSRRAVTGVRTPRYHSVYGSGVGSGTGQYRRPGAITVSPLGGGSCARYVFVADSGNNRIQKLNWDICASPQPVLSHSAYIYQGSGNGGYGALNNPHDVDYCDLNGDASAADDFLVVADTDNHRVLAMRPDGTVLWSVGGTQGSGANQFSYPYAVTALKVFASGNTAYIYVADRGNNRVVWLRQNSNLTVSWLKTLPLPAPPTPSGAGFPSVGLQDIEVDAVNVLSGVFVADSRVHKVYQLDFFLNDVITSYDGFGGPGSRMYGLETTWGELCVLSPYTKRTGAELFQVRASIEGMSASPRVIDPPVEWMTVSIPLTRGGNLRVWVESHPGGVRKGTLLNTGVPSPTIEYALWDGRDSTSVEVADGSYRIIARIKDDDWAFSDYDTIVVEVHAGIPIKALAQRTFIEEPDWSPTGEQLVYSGGASSSLTAPLAIYRIDADGTNSTALTSTTSGRYLHGAWSPDGTKIAYSKDLISGFPPKRALYVMTNSGSSQTLLSDLTGAPDWFREERPQWIDGGRRLSYTRAWSNGVYNQLNSMDAAGGDVEAIRVTTEWISAYGWSPNQASFAFVQEGSTQSLVYRHDLADDSWYLLSHDDPGVYEQALGVDWAPDGRRLVTLQNSIHFGSRWDVLGLSPMNGGASPFIGLGSPEGTLRRGVRFSPDGTKVAFPLDSYVGEEKVDLLITDTVRGTSAFPSALLYSPSASDTLAGIVQIVGSVDTNFSVVDTVLSVPTTYSVRWGAGLNPSAWSSQGMVQPAGNIVELDGLASWNTGVVATGWYTLKLSASDGVDSNVVVRPVYVRHRRLNVDDGGGSGIYTTIQSALSAAAEGDTVYVEAGTYTGPVDLRSSVHVIAAASGVTVTHGGNGFAMRAIDLEWPTRVVGMTITHPTFTSSYGGISIDDSKVTFDDCRIEDVWAGGIGGGARIGGTSHVTFRRCVFADNKASDGAGAAIRGVGTAKPTALFIECVFDGNEVNTGSGAAVWVQYDALLDTTQVAPEFQGCVFSNNTASVTGSAVLVDNCRRAVFRSCTFVDNYLSSTSGAAVLDGTTSGAEIIQCTFANNDRSGSNTFSLVGLNGYTGHAKPIRVDKSLFALNTKAEAIENAHKTKYAITKSDFHGNQTGDTYWLTHGTDNLNLAPAFCNAPTGDYGLMAFSPCAHELTGFGNIGSSGVRCVPDASVSVIATAAPDTLIFGCPKGLACTVASAESLLIQIDFDNGQMTRTIGVDELAIALPYEPFGLFSDKPMLADSPAASPNYIATIGHKSISGSGRDSLTVLLNGYPLEQKALVRRRGPDINGDGDVNLGDYSIYGMHHTSPPKQYNEACDFNAVNGINLIDYGLWGAHYQHKHAFAGPLLSPEQNTASNGTIELQFEEEFPLVGERLLRARVFINNIEPFSAVMIALRNENPLLAYREWVAAPDYPAVTTCAEVVRDGTKQIMLGVIGSKEIARSRIELGTIVVAIQSEAALELRSEDFSLLLADVLETNGALLTVSASSVSKAVSAQALRNELGQNYPNPFNPSTTVSFSLASEAAATLRIYDVRGAEIRTLVNDRRKAGVYRIKWDGTDNSGQRVASGVYFFKLSAGSFTDTKKMTMLK